MPELPEVETVRRTLEHQILNEKIVDVKVLYEGILENVTKEEFKQNLINETITDIKRYGKYLVFIFNHVSIISHLRMEGKFFLKSIDDPIIKHEHIIFYFESGRTLRYHDTRKFGKMALIHSTSWNEIMSYPSVKKLGPEANTTNLTKEYLYSKLKKLKEPIKSALLNQEILAGLGNIYVDEVCFMAKLYPGMSCEKITLEDCDNIVKYSREILNQAILAGGTTIRSYTSSLGVTGRFQLSLHIHTKEGEACERCHTTIKKMVVGGRGTYYCPNCQKDRLPKVIGLTGGIASGKSTVSTYLKNKGYIVIDSDEIVNKLYQNKQIIEIIKTTFGDEYIYGGKINKPALGNLVFNNQESLNKLNSLIHPLVKAKIISEIKKQSDGIIFIDVPLLFEANFEDLCDQIIVVNVEPKQNIERLMKRDNIDETFAVTKISSQLPLQQKCEKANFIIDNSRDLCYTYTQIDNILTKLN